MTAVKGYVRGNAVVAEDEALRIYDGKNVTVTVIGQSEPYYDIESLETQLNSIRIKAGASWGEDATEYIRKLRDDERVF